jgi:Ribbon-helix-helix protein, copG family
MRTTLRLDDDLFADLRRRAAEEGVTLSVVVNRALREAAAARPPRRRRPFRQTTHEMRALFDVTRANEYADAIEDAEVLRIVSGRQ